MSLGDVLVLNATCIAIVSFEFHVWFQLSLISQVDASVKRDTYFVEVIDTHVMP